MKTLKCTLNKKYDVLKQANHNLFKYAKAGCMFYTQKANRCALCSPYSNITQFLMQFSDVFLSDYFKLQQSFVRGFMDGGLRNFYSLAVYPFFNIGNFIIIRFTIKLVYRQFSRPNGFLDSSFTDAVFNHNLFDSQ